jgi:hypothetical protein
MVINRLLSIAAVALMLAACQGPGGVGRLPGDTLAAPGMGTPAAGKKTAPPDEKNRPAPATSNGPPAMSGSGALILYVSNQSFAINPVEIKVFIDGRKVIDDKFPIRYQRNWRKYPFELTKGTHHLRIESANGDAIWEETLDIARKQWGVINYWCQPKDAESLANAVKKITFELKNEPFYFDQ